MIFSFYRLYEESDSHNPLVMPQTVLLSTFWLKNDSVLFNKQINILIDWVIYSYREKYRTIDVSDLPNANIKKEK